MNTMRAIVAHGIGDYRCERIPKPEAGPGEALVRVISAGICAADKKSFDGSGPWKPRFPYVPGHEFFGEVVELGEGAGEKWGLAVGDKAIAELIIPCRECHYCHSGLYHLCIKPKIFGSAVPGGWAEYMLFPSNSTVFKVPGNVGTEGVLVEPVACAVHAVERVGIGLSDTVVVSGMGPIGLSMLQVAKQKNPRFIVALDVDDRALTVAKSLGANYTFNVSTDAFRDAVRELTDGLGCHVYLEASGYGGSIENGIGLLRKRGRMMIYGVYPAKVAIDFTQVGEFKELELIGGHLSPNSYSTAIRLIAEGKVDAKPMITHEFAFEECMEALKLKACGAAGEDRPAIKVVFLPSISAK